MIIKNSNVLCPDFCFREQDIFTYGERFSSSGGGEVIDASGLFAIPGLIDIHLHGCAGHDFCEGTEEALAAIAKYQAKSGVTAFCPATMSLPEEDIGRACAQAANFDGEGSIVAGIMLEGPFFNAEKKGAQNEEHLRTPSIDMYNRLQALCGGMIKIACVAPELPGALDFIKEASQSCKVSLAHTVADYDTAVSAFGAGATHVTHLFNAMPHFIHRSPGLIGAAADCGADVELICDGTHLHPSVVRSTFMLFGGDSIIMISDSMMATGLPDGEYSLGGQSVTVKSRQALLADGTIAGSASNLMDCLRHAVLIGIPLETAVKAASLNPARAIGRDNDMGSIEDGKLANLVLLDENLDIVKVIINGQIIVD